MVLVNKFPVSHSTLFHLNKYIRKSLKIVLWIVACVVLLVVLIAVSLNIPAVQNFAKNKAIGYLKKKTHTEVRLESIKIALPKDIVLNKFYIEDLKKDTLLYAEKLSVDISLFKLLKNKVEINDISLKKIRANIKRIDPDTAFNFSFLVDAFMSEQKKPDEEVDKDTTSTMKFAIDKVSFEDIGIVYRDDVAGNDVKLYLGEFKAKLKDFDLAGQHYVIKSLSLNNTSLDYLQQKPLTQLKEHLEKSIDTAQAETGKLPLVEVQDFAFSNIRIGFDDRISGMNADVALKKLELSKLFVDLTNSNYKVAEAAINDTKIAFNSAANKADVALGELSFDQLLADVKNGKYSVGDASLRRSDIGFALKPAPKMKDTVRTDTTASAPLSLVVGSISLAENNISFDNLTAKPVKGMDFNHLRFTGLTLNADDIGYSDQGIKVNVKQGSFKEKSGFQLNRLQGKVAYNEKQIKVDGFQLKTPNTSIENNTQLDYTSMDDLTKHPEKVKVSMTVNNTVIGLRDAAYFSDAVPVAYRNEKIRLNASAHGYMNNIVVPKLQVSGLKNTHIDISGTAKGLPDMEKAVLDLDIRRFSLTKGDLLVLIPKKSLPTSIELPNAINAVGKFKGSMTSFNTGFNIRTDMGSAKLAAMMRGPKGKENYAANINLIDFNVGRLLKQQPALGRITAKAIVKGRGLDAKTAAAQLNAQIISAGYNKYNYRDLNISGSYAAQQLDLKSNMADSNLNFDLIAKVNMAGKYPAVKADLNLTEVDLQKLNFSPTEFKLAGLVTADIKTADPDYLNGDVSIRGLQLVKEGQKFNMDTIDVHSEASETHNLLTLRSEILNARIDGKYQLTNLGNALVNQINKYYAFGEVTTIPDQRFRFYVKIYNPKFLKNFVPELTGFSPSYMSGLIDTQKDSLQVRAWFPQVVYGDFKVDSTRLDVNNDNQQLTYKLLIKSFQSPSVSLYNSEVSGQAANNQLGLNIMIRDSKQKDRYVLGGIFKSINKDYQFSLDPNKLLLDYEKWVISPENYLQFGQSGILANQFNLSKGGQLLSINSSDKTPNSPISVQFKDFRIETLTRFAEQDSALVGGVINGTAEVKELMDSTPKFNANLTIDQLRYQKDQLGTLRVAVNNNTANAYEVNVALAGVHELRVNGFYYTNSENALDLTVNLDKVDLSQLESLSMGQIKRGSGAITGQLSVKGAVTAPRVLGDIHFNQVAFTAAYVNSYFRIPDETISFTSQGINFNDFDILDSLGRKATISGGVLTTDYKDIKFNMDIRTDNFRALNSTAQDNDMIYGTVYLTSNIKVRGDLNQPDVDMNITVEKGTKFFFALPVEDPSVIDQEGIVQFIDADAAPFNGQKVLNGDSISKSPVKGINLSANVTIDPDAELNVVVDPSNGDALRVKGQANLVADMDPSGKTSLTGRYEISEGSYNLSIGPFSKKEFKLVKGSAIVWTGDPMSANVDLTALYEVNAAPIDLLNEPENAQAKTKLPIQVYLMMKDELMKPKISFRLDLPENERGALSGTVYTRLLQVNQDENELNKQVFALLALNRFIAENPFQSLAGGGGGISTIARSSVSKLLTEQLNNLAADLIQGVDVNFGINSSEDYSSGSLEQKTDLEVGLSKKLLNDRLTVTVGSSFGLEGTSNQPGEKSTNIAGNVNVEYALSADGRYRLRAYRRNQNEGVIEGQIIETGLGFALVVDYNKFREIFRRKETREQRRARRQKNEVREQENRIKEATEQKPTNEKTN